MIFLLLHFVKNKKNVPPSRSFHCHGVLLLWAGISLFSLASGERGLLWRILEWIYTHGLCFLGPIGGVLCQALEGSAYLNRLGTYEFRSIGLVCNRELFRCVEVGSWHYM